MRMHQRMSPRHLIQRFATGPVGTHKGFGVRPFALPRQAPWRAARAVGSLGRPLRSSSEGGCRFPPRRDPVTEQCARSIL